MVWEEFFNGNEIIHHFRNPYSRPVPVDGTDGFQFSPKLDTDSVIKYFDDFALRPIPFKYDSKVVQGDVEAYKFVVDSKQYSNPAVFPDTFECPMLNVSPVYETPLFVALPNYQGCMIYSLAHALGMEKRTKK